MNYVALGRYLPDPIAARLFGNRSRFGKVPDRSDPNWIEWMERSVDFYNANQRSSVGRPVNHAGYHVMRQVDLAGKRVLEIGPGALDHMDYWSGMPKHYTCVDINQSYMELAIKRLELAGIPYSAVLNEPSDEAHLPFESECFDVVLSFYSLEHIHPLEPILREMRRVVRPGGVIAGAIPCEGGMAWGLGRYFTSRRWLLRNTTIDPDRIICWEHPNFADTILNALRARSDASRISFWPLRIPSVDVNLIARFVVTVPSKEA